MRLLACAVLLAWSGPGHASGWPADLAGWWLTPDQQGQRLLEQERFLEAAERFEDPARRGAAYYRGGDFERAAGVFGRLRSPEAAYNRGNALVLLGKYDDAISSYELALELRPGWAAAQDNLALAVARKALLAPPESDEGGTGGMLGADEIVFDDSGRVAKSGAEEVIQGESGLSDAELRAVWLRRVQNDPADFLRARFAWQLQREELESGTRALLD
jgi:Ca-activated chloride channel family protein